MYQRTHSAVETKLLYISHAVSNFYGTEIEVWADLGPWQYSNEKIGANNDQNFEVVFLMLPETKRNRFFLKYCTQKSCIKCN